VLFICARTAAASFNSLIVNIKKRRAPGAVGLLCSPLPVSGGLPLSTKGRGQRAETALRAILQARGYPCIRSAASKALDVVALRPWDSAVGFEVKTTLTPTRLDLRRHDVEQWDEMLGLYQRGYFVRYVVRWPGMKNGEFKGAGEHWEVYHPTDGPILRTGQGIPLDDFLSSVFPQHSPYSPPREMQADERDGQGGGTD